MAERKYFLDWLRVIAFGLLVLFHVGMLYVTWDYNLKSPRVYAELELAMIALSPWRLPLLFFISGVASRFLLAKLGPGPFASDRVRRLLPVVLFGMLVVNPPQTYVELVHEGLVTSGYLEFWLTSYLVGDPYPGKILPTWDHLWFLVYLLAYALCLALVVRVGRVGGNRAGGDQGASVMAWVVCPGIWLVVSNILVSEVNPVTHAFVDDWAAHLRWAGMFGAGVACAMRREYWDALRHHRRTLLGLSGLFLVLELASSLYRRTGQMDPVWDGIAYAVASGLFGWTTILALAGYAAAYLNRPSALLSYLTVAVLPIYVLHQPILLIGAYLIFPLRLPVLLEAGLLTGVTAAGAFGLYELAIRRWNAVRFVFGLRPLASSP